MNRAGQQEGRDHGGNLDAAIARWGGARGDWLDLSTGINPVPYPVADMPADAWSALPGRVAQDRLTRAARRFWNVPDEAVIVPAAGASALISRMPELAEGATAHIPGPTYNEHAAAFRLHGIAPGDDPNAPIRVFVHPNNPDGRMWRTGEILDGHDALTVIDESFCDVAPEASHIAATARPGVVVLKSFGKFWGLAGLRLGFAIGLPETLARPGHRAQSPVDLAEILGPWSVSGPALHIGAQALEDTGWAAQTRARLAGDAARLDRLMAPLGALVGGTALFRLYDVSDAPDLQERLAAHRIWSRVFPYSHGWIRLGLPQPDRWAQLEAALADARS